MSNYLEYTKIDFERVDDETLKFTIPAGDKVSAYFVVTDIYGEYKTLSLYTHDNQPIITDVSFDVYMLMYMYTDTSNRQMFMGPPIESNANKTSVRPIALTGLKETTMQLLNRNEGNDVVLLVNGMNSLTTKDNIHMTVCYMKSH